MPGAQRALNTTRAYKAAVRHEIADLEKLTQVALLNGEAAVAVHAMIATLQGLLRPKHDGIAPVAPGPIAAEMINERIAALRAVTLVGLLTPAGAKAYEDMISAFEHLVARS